jgi:hypothetical protein
MTPTIFSFCCSLPIMCWLEMSRWRDIEGPKTNNGVPVYTQQRPHLILEKRPKNEPAIHFSTTSKKPLYFFFGLRTPSLSSGRLSAFLAWFAVLLLLTCASALRRQQRPLTRLSGKSMQRCDVTATRVSRAAIFVS